MGSKDLYYLKFVTCIKQSKSFIKYHRYQPYFLLTKPCLSKQLKSIVHISLNLEAKKKWVYKNIGYFDKNHMKPCIDVRCDFWKKNWIFNLFTWLKWHAAENPQQLPKNYTVHWLLGSDDYAIWAEKQKFKFSCRMLSIMYGSF